MLLGTKFLISKFMMKSVFEIGLLADSSTGSKGSLAPCDPCEELPLPAWVPRLAYICKEYKEQSCDKVHLNLKDWNLSLVPCMPPLTSASQVRIGTSRAKHKTLSLIPWMAWPKLLLWVDHFSKNLLFQIWSSGSTVGFPFPHKTLLAEFGEYNTPGLWQSSHTFFCGYSPFI